MKRWLARAKVNLALHVTGRRNDGFHLLDSLVCFSDVADILTVFDNDALELDVTGPCAATVPKDRKNLVFAAAALLGKPDGARIVLEKNLPVAAGIGGGSADAAAALWALTRLWGRVMPSNDAITALGADVPVCLANHAARVRGIGEHVEAISHMPAFHGVLVNPGKPLPTAAVFRETSIAAGDGLENLPPGKGVDDWIDYLCRQRNDLQAPAIKLVPEIREVLDTLAKSKGCGLARMSGSGATCFGLFYGAAQACHAADDIKRMHPNWWVMPTRLE